MSSSYTLVGRKDLPFNTLPEVLAYAKANPGKLHYASAGVGSGQHVLGAALWHLAKVDLGHVPYRGAQPACQDLPGGRVALIGDDARAVVLRDVEHWSKLVKTLGIRAE